MAFFERECIVLFNTPALGNATFGSILPNASGRPLTRAILRIETPENWTANLSIEVVSYTLNAAQTIEHDRVKLTIRGVPDESWDFRRVPAIWQLPLDETMQKLQCSMIATLEDLAWGEGHRFFDAQANGVLYCMRFKVLQSCVLGTGTVPVPEGLHPMQRRVRDVLMSLQGMTGQDAITDTDEWATINIFLVRDPTLVLTISPDGQNVQLPALERLRARLRAEADKHAYGRFFQNENKVHCYEPDSLLSIRECPNPGSLKFQSVFYDAAEMAIFEGASVIREHQLLQDEWKRIRKIPVQAALVQSARSWDEIYLAVLRMPPNYPYDFADGDALELRWKHDGVEAVWKLRVSRHSFPLAQKNDICAYAKRPRVPICDEYGAVIDEAYLRMDSGPEQKDIFDLSASSDASQDENAPGFFRKDLPNLAFLSLVSEDRPMKARLQALEKLNTLNSGHSIIPQELIRYKLGHCVTGGKLRNIHGTDANEIDRKLALFSLNRVNESQRRALKYLAACPNGRGFVEGFPGSGKTLLSAVVATIAVSNGKKVLVVAPSNRIADNFALVAQRMLDQSGVKRNVVRLHNLSLENQAVKMAMDTRQSIDAQDAELFCTAMLEAAAARRSVNAEGTRDGRFQIEHLSLARRVLNLAHRLATSPSTTLLSNEQALRQVLKYNEMLSKGKHLTQEDKAQFRKSVFGLQMGYLEHGAHIIVTTVVNAENPSLQAATRRSVSLVLAEEAGKLSSVDMNIVYAGWPNASVLQTGESQQLGPHAVSIEKNPWAAQLNHSEFATKIQAGAPVAVLREQYRIEPGLSDIISTLMYDAEFSKFCKPGEQHVLISRVDPALRPNITLVRRYFQDIRASNKNFAAINVNGRHRLVGKTQSKLNDEELATALVLVQGLLGRGIEPRDITLLSGYRGHNEATRKALREHEDRRLKRVLCSTIDNAQGLENSVVIFSLVGTDTLGFLAERARFLVALTRAKDAFILLGNFSRLCARLDRHGMPLLHKVLHEFSKHGAPVTTPTWQSASQAI